MPLLEVADLKVSYGKALAIESVSIKVEKGELIGVLGPERRRQDHAAEGHLAQHRLAGHAELQGRVAGSDRAV